MSSYATAVEAAKALNSTLLTVQGKIRRTNARHRPIRMAAIALMAFVWTLLMREIVWGQPRAERAAARRSDDG